MGLTFLWNRSMKIEVSTLYRSESSIMSVDSSFSERSFNAADVRGSFDLLSTDISKKSSTTPRKEETQNP